MGDVDLEHRRLRVSENAVRVNTRILVGTPKTHHTRVVPIPPLLADEIGALRQGKDETALLFSSNGGLLAATHGEGRLVCRANVKAVRRMLGHASAAMTLDVYTDLFEEDLDRVSLVLDEARSRSACAACAQIIVPRPSIGKPTAPET